MSIGGRIAKLRKNYSPSMTQEEFAKKIGISRAALSHYEKDRRDPDYETLQKIADFFDVSTDYILSGQSGSSTPKEEKGFEEWANNPKLDSFYKEFNQSPEDRQAALLAVWEILKNQEKKEN